MSSRKRRSPDAVDALRDAALERLGEEPPPETPPDDLSDAPGDEGEARAPRKPRPVDPAVVALFPTGVMVVHETIAAAAKTWREATEREAPSVEKLSAEAVVTRIDADAASGYVAVVTADDTWRAFLPRDQLAMIVALILRRPIEDVARQLASGPGSLTPARTES
jgi:hypothetical protein